VGTYVRESAVYSMTDEALDEFDVQGNIIERAPDKLYVFRDGIIYSYDMATKQEVALAEISGSLYQAKLYKGNLYIGGFFDEVNGEARSNFAIINAQTGELDSVQINFTYSGHPLD